MKRIYLLLILSILSSIGLFAQKELQIRDIEMMNLGDGQQYAHQRDESKTPIDGSVRIITGYTTEYVDANFKAGYPEGEWKYYKNNKLSELSNYVNGYLEGAYISYYVDGALKSKTHFKKNKLNGSIVRYASNDKKEYEANMTDGQLDGMERFYNNDGKVREETFYKMGKPEGKSFSAMQSNLGDYKINRFYKDGFLHGEYTEVFEGGVVKRKGKYLVGKKVGRWEQRKEDDMPRLTEEYNNGDVVRKITYYTNGNVDADKSYNSNGKEHGSIKKYTVEGTLKTDHNYVNGRQVGLQITHMTSNAGNYVETANYNERGQKDGAYTEVFADGNNIKAKGKYLKGQKDGKWVYGYKNGSLYKEEVYNNGSLSTSKSL